MIRRTHKGLCVLGFVATLTVSPVFADESASTACTYGMFWRDSVAPAPAFPAQTRAPAPSRPSVYSVQVLASGLEHPWSLAFLPDGRMLVTERVGRMRLVSRDGNVSAPIRGLPRIKRMGGFGLWDVVLDPDFVHNRILYFNYFSPPLGEPEQTQEENLKVLMEWVKKRPAERKLMNIGKGRVARARLSQDGAALEDVQPIVEGVLDGRLRIAPDGMLLITSGTPAGAGTPVDEEPQDLSNAYGKVLRVRRDGSIPADNPFIGRKNVRPDLFSYGVRDVQGAAIEPRTGLLWTSENGPRGGDELNVHRPGANYGFPLVSYGREYSGKAINGGLTARSGVEQPAYFWTPSIAPSGMTFYNGNLFPEWKGNLFVAALGGKRIERLVLKGGRVVAEESLLLERCQRMRTVHDGPDGTLYVLTDEDSAQLLRIAPR